jgi:hypothetical protein
MTLIQFHLQKNPVSFSPEGGHHYVRSNSILFFFNFNIKDKKDRKCNEKQNYHEFFYTYSEHGIFPFRGNIVHLILFRNHRVKKCSYWWL